MGTPELDDRLSGLRSYMAALTKSQQKPNADFEEAQWMISVLEKYSLIANRFKICYAYEVAQPQTVTASAARVRPLGF